MYLAPHVREESMSMFKLDTIPLLEVLRLKQMLDEDLAQVSQYMALKA
jgi:hypothetical protein